MTYFNASNVEQRTKVYDVDTKEEIKLEKKQTGQPIEFTNKIEKQKKE